MVDLHDFRLLLTETGQAALQEAVDFQPREQDFLRLFTKLKQRYPDPIARAALEIAILRRKAEDKFPAAQEMYFTREALEQATSCQISAYRAARFAGFDYLVDLGCSIGGDTLALVELAPTLGIDQDYLRLAMARENLSAVGLDEQASFVCADLMAELPVKARGSMAVFFDPARRTMGYRVHSVHDYQPPLTVINSWLLRFPALAVKASPGVDLAELNNLQAEIEFISFQGELKEATLWFGPLKTTTRRATLLPGPYSMFSDECLSSYPIYAHPGDLTLDEPRAYLYEPDPAVLRAGLVRDLGQMLGAAQLDPDIAYLTSDQKVDSPFARRWEVETWFPFQLKRLREALRQRRVGRVTIKKRGSPLQPEVLMHALRLKGDQRRVIFLTHLRGNPVVILAYHPEHAGG